MSKSDQTGLCFANEYTSDELAGSLLLTPGILVTSYLLENCGGNTIKLVM